MLQIKNTFNSPDKKKSAFHLFFTEEKNKYFEQGLAFIPALIWGGVALVSGAAAWWAGKSALSGAVADLLAGLLIWVSYLFQYVSRFLAFTAADIFDTSLTLFEKSITRNVDFIKGWVLVRDFSNMFIVLGFVVVGIATTLRIRDYEAKKLLLPLILIALLINFSGLFCGIIIDASNILAKSLISSAGISGKGTSGAISGLGTQFYTMAVKFVDTGLQSISEGTDKAGNLKFLQTNIMLSFIFLAIAGTFFYMAILFTARYVILAFLFILSPLAFVCKIFPISRTQEIWKMWWENFLKWAFIGVGGTLSLWIAASFMKSVISGDKLTVENLFIILLFLVIGFKITTKSSAMGASAVIGLAGGAAGLAMGVARKAGMGTLKGLGKGADALSRGKLSSAAQKVTGGVGRTMERLGLRKEGLTAMKEGAVIAEEKKRYEAMFNSGNAADKQRAIQAAKTGRGKNKAAAYAAAVSTENLNDTFKDSSGRIDVDAMARGAKFTEQFGAGENLRRQAVKQNPHLAAANESKVDENIRKLGYANRFQAGPNGLAKAKAMTIGDAVGSTSPGDASKWDAGMLTPEVLAALNKNQAIEIAKRGKPKLVEKLKNFKRSRDAAGNVNPLTMQSPEYKVLNNHILTNYGAGSPEATRVAQILNEMETNAVFR